MTQEYLLMRNLIRTSHLIRRSPQQPESNGQPRIRGYGHILEVLSASNGISQQKIAEAIGIRQQAVSEAIAAMEQQGYVQKAPSPDDRRVTLIYITEAGASHMEEIIRLRTARAGKVFSVFTQQEKQTLMTLLNKLNQSFNQEDL